MMVDIDIDMDTDIGAYADDRNSKSSYFIEWMDDCGSLSFKETSADSGLV